MRRRPTDRAGGHRGAIPLAALVALAAGCGPAGPPCHPISGAVTLRGQSVPGAVIVFHDPGTGVFLSATCDQAGRYATAHLPGGGLPEGRYRVAVQPPVVEIEIDPDHPRPMTDAVGFPALDELVFDPGTSGLVLEVSGAPAGFDIDLTPFAAARAGVER